MIGLSVREDTDRIIISGFAILDAASPFVLPASVIGQPRGIPGADPTDTHTVLMGVMFHDTLDLLLTP